MKTPKFSELRRLGSRLFHSMIDHEKKEFLKLCLILKRGILSAFLVTYDVFSGINLKKVLWTFKDFVKHSKFSLTTLWLLLWPAKHYTERIPAFGENTYYTLDHKGYHHNQDGRPFQDRRAIAHARAHIRAKAFRRVVNRTHKPSRFYYLVTCV